MYAPNYKFFHAITDVFGNWDGKPTRNSIKWTLVQGSDGTEPKYQWIREIGKSIFIWIVLDVSGHRNNEYSIQEGGFWGNECNFTNNEGDSIVRMNEISWTNENSDVGWKYSAFAALDCSGIMAMSDCLGWPRFRSRHTATRGKGKEADDHEGWHGERDDEGPDKIGRNQRKFCYLTLQQIQLYLKMEI